MKRRYGMALMICLSGTAQISADLVETITKKLSNVCCSLKELGNCACKCISLSQKDFLDEDTIPSQTRIIDEPGNYCFIENVSFTPKAPQVPCIIVRSSDVKIDLCGHTLSQTNKSVVAQTIAIVVETGFENVNIIGSYGAIQDFSQLGIQVQSGTKNIHIGDATRLDLTNNGGGTDKTFVDTFFPFQFPSICGVTEPPVFYEGAMQIGDSLYLAFQGFPVSDFNNSIKVQLEAGATPSVDPTIVESLYIDNVYADCNTFGMFMGNVSQASITGSSFSSNVNTRPSGVPFIGAESNTTYAGGIIGALSQATGDTGWKDVTFDSTVINGNFAFRQNSGDAAKTLPFYVSNKHSGLVMRDCECNENKAESDNQNIPTEVYACELGGGSCTVVERCQFLNNIATQTVSGFTQGSGSLKNPLFGISDNPEFIRVQGQSLAIRKSVASSNSVRNNSEELVPSISATGFSLSSINGASLSDLVTDGNEAIAETQSIDLAQSSGLNIQSDVDPLQAKNIDIRGFHASSNKSSSNKDSLSFGVRVENAQLLRNLSISDAYLSNNGTQESTTTAGISLISEVVNEENAPLITIDRSYIDGHQFGVSAGNCAKTMISKSTIVRNQKGINFKMCPCSVIKENVFLHNSECAVRDQTTPSTVLVAQNKGFNNGGGTTGNGYDVTYAFQNSDPAEFPVVKGFIGNPGEFPQDAQVCDNVHIVKDAKPVDVQK